MCPFPHLPHMDDTHIINERILVGFSLWIFMSVGCDTISESDNEFECVFMNMFFRVRGTGSVRKSHF